MKRHNNKRGFTVVEMMVASLCTLILGAGCYTLIRTTYESQWMLLNQNNSNMQSRNAVDTMVDKIRGLTTLTAVTQPSDITFTDPSGSVRYWRNTADNTLRTTTGGLPAGGTIVAQGVTALTFSYWSYSGGWTQSTTPATLANVGAIDVTATVTTGVATSPFSRQVFSSLKLRQLRFNNASGF